MKRSTFSLAALGGSSLLTIFGVLCLVIFTLLTISTARAQQSLSLASAKAVADYYQADSMAEEILAGLRQGEVPPGVRQEGNLFSYECPLSDSSCLTVRVQAQQEGWTILQWQVVSTLTGAENESLTVWDGTEEELP